MALSAVRAVIQGTADMQPLDHPVTECVAVAKRGLKPGETLGKIGQVDYRGHATIWREARDAKAILIGILEKAEVTRQIKAGQPLTYDACTPDTSMVVTQIRQRLDQSDARFVGVS